MSDNLTAIENFSLTDSLTKQLAKLAHNKSHPCLGELAARAISFVSTPFTALIDVIAHSILAGFKIVFNTLIATPINFIAKRFNRNLFSKDFHFSSGFVHLVNVVDLLFKIVRLPFKALFAPSRSLKLDESTQIKTLKELGVNNEEKSGYIKQIEDLKEECKDCENIVNSLTTKNPTQSDLLMRYLLKDDDESIKKESEESFDLDKIDMDGDVEDSVGFFQNAAKRKEEEFEDQTDGIDPSLLNTNEMNDIDDVLKELENFEL